DCRSAWSSWKVTTFPPAVCRHVTLMILTASEEAGGRTLRDILDAADVPVPVTIEPGVEERLAELGMHAEVRSRIRHTCGMIPGLLRLRVEVTARMDGSEPVVAVVAVHDASADPGSRFDHPLIRWYLTTFPAEVRENVFLGFQPE